MKNAFYFILKALSISTYFNFCLDKKDKVNLKFMTSQPC